MKAKERIVGWKAEVNATFCFTVPLLDVVGPMANPYFQLLRGYENLR